MLSEIEIFFTVKNHAPLPFQLLVYSLIVVKVVTMRSNRWRHFEFCLIFLLLFLLLLFLFRLKTILIVTNINALSMVNLDLSVIINSYLNISNASPAISVLYIAVLLNCSLNFLLSLLFLFNLFQQSFLLRYPSILYLTFFRFELLLNKVFEESQFTFTFCHRIFKLVIRSKILHRLSICRNLLLRAILTLRVLINR